VRYVRKGSREAIFSSDILLLTNDAWRKTSNMAFLAMKGYLVSVEHARHVLKCTCDAMMQSLAEDVKRRTSNVLRWIPIWNLQQAYRRHLWSILDSAEADREMLQQPPTFCDSLISRSTLSISNIKPTRELLRIDRLQSKPALQIRPCLIFLPTKLMWRACKVRHWVV
jgi:hypothetical protein